jgi:signal transduction histidine kinase
MHVAIETLVAVIGSVAAYLMLGRYRMSARLADLLLALALFIFAVGSFFFSVLPAALSNDDITHFSTWAPIMSGLLGAFGFAVAAFSRRELRLKERALLIAGCAFLGIVCAIAVATEILAAKLPVAIPPALSPVRGGRQLVIGQPAVLTAQLLTMVLFAAAAVGFLRRGERSNDELMKTLSIGAIVGAFASLNYFLFPSLYSQWVYSGDILRLSFYLIILFGVARELNAYWRGLARAAALEERRRIARDLHDGLAQELAFIASQSRLLRRGAVERRLAAAAERALAESRQAIDALTRPLEEPLDRTITRAAEEIATRFGVGLDLKLKEGVVSDGDTRDAFRRIVREATTNAAQHGRAKHVAVSLELVEEQLRLRICDDGSGFEPGGEFEGFGLISMRERAARIGGDLRLRSAPGAGTTVEVLVP